MKPFIRQSLAVALLASAAFAGSAATVVSSADAEVRIKKNYMKFNGNRYFRRNSTDVKIGSWGRKFEPATQANYLSPTDDLDDPGPIVSSGTFYVDQSSDFSVNHNGEMAIPIKLAKLDVKTDVMMQWIRDRKCGFKRHTVDSVLDLRSRMNNDSQLIDEMKQRNDSRIVYDVLAVDHCTISNRFLTDATSNGQVSLAGLGIKIKGKDNLQGETKVTFVLAKDSIIAYRLQKPKWDKKKKKNRTRITELRPDNQGLN